MLLYVIAVCTVAQSGYLVNPHVLCTSKEPLRTLALLAIESTACTVSQSMLLVNPYNHLAGVVLSRCLVGVNNRYCIDFHRVCQ